MPQIQITKTMRVESIKVYQYSDEAVAYVSNELSGEGYRCAEIFITKEKSTKNLNNGKIREMAIATGSLSDRQKRTTYIFKNGNVLVRPTDQYTQKLYKEILQKYSNYTF